LPEITVVPYPRVVIPDPQPLCRHWFPAGTRWIESLTRAGFSGSPLFLVRAADGEYVLKAFTPGTLPGRVRFVHALMRQLRSHGLGEVPELLDAVGGESFVVDEAGLPWEMQRFVVGEPSFEPTDPQVAAALAVLARIHAAAARMPENPPDAGPSPSIARRIDQARAWLERPWEAIGERPAAAATNEALGLEMRPRIAAAAATLRHARGEHIIAAVARLEPRPLARQSIVRDLWAAHVLFAADDPARVSGIVDFHAATTDTPASDVARLLGSWLTDEAVGDTWWSRRLAAYLPTSEPQPARGFRELVMFLAASGIVFGLDNWFRWVMDDGRVFEEPRAVTGRVDRLLANLPVALEILRGNPKFLGLTGKNSSL
jgi:Ser/Thr protein kinase RdoA (MazF antagonist)